MMIDSPTRQARPSLNAFFPHRRGLFIQVLCLFLLSMGALAAQPKVQLGIDVLESMDFRPLQGKRVGLLTHPAGVNRNGRSTIDILKQSPRVNLVALYGPEHGIDGKAKADVYVPSSTDPRTGLPVHSLYADTRKPTPAMLRGLDIMVIDLQDLGTRSYTYISAMKRTMEACFEQEVEVMVLDRPNPLGGLKVDGPMLNKGLESYVGAFYVPYVYGLTIGELARMTKVTPGWMEISPDKQRNGRLTVIPMRGWSRDMLWPDTGLRWIPTSPAIPDVSAAMGYPMTGLGSQIGGFQHGYGTRFPFRLLTYPGKSPVEIAQALNQFNIPGIQLRPIRFQDHNGQQREGAYVVITDWQQVRPTEISFYMMKLAVAWDSRGNPFTNAASGSARLYNIHVGSMAWWEAITTRGAQVQVEPFIELWQREALAFQRQSQRFWLYQ